jgi:antitoxin ParD1/3/4
MSKLERITVTVPEEMAAKMRAAIESGEYATTSEIVREAVRDWNAAQIRNIRSVQELREMLEKAAAGPSVDGEAFMAELKEQVASRVARRAKL